MTSVRPPAPTPPAQPAAIPDTPAATAPITATTPVSVNGPGEPVSVRVRREGVVVLRVQVPPEEGVVHLGSYGSVRQG